MKKRIADRVSGEKDQVEPLVTKATFKLGRPNKWTFKYLVT